jgi:hypothetical protein
MAWRRSERNRSLIQGAAAGFAACAAAAALIFIPLRRNAEPIRPRQRTADPAVAALESWASPDPFGGEFRAQAPESDDSGLGDEGEP